MPISPEEMDALMAEAPQPAASSGPEALPPHPAEPDTPRGAAVGDGLEDTPMAIKPDQEPGLSDPTSTLLDAPIAGAVKAGLETADFVTGKGGEKSGAREAFEAKDKELSHGSLPYTFASGLSQFAVGMIGAGKLLRAAEGVGAVGSAVGALRGIRGGESIISSGKAAAVGAIAFDPNGGRLSDLVQGTFLANPVNEFLATKGDDTPAIGRMKNALESIGLDAAVAGVFTASVKGYKAFQAYRAGQGTAEAVAQSTDELAHAVSYQESKRALGAGDHEKFLDAMAEHPEAAGKALDDHVTAQQPASGPIAGETFRDYYERLGMTVEDATSPRYHAAYEAWDAARTENPGAFPSFTAGEVSRDRSVATRDSVQVEGSPPAAANDTGVPRDASVQEALTPQAQRVAAAEDISRTEPSRPAENTPPDTELGLQHTSGRDVADVINENAAARSARQAAADGEVEVSRVQSATEAGAPPRRQLDGVSDEQVSRIIEHGINDTNALLGPGGWEGAIARGYTFGDGGRIPWQKFAQATNLEAGTSPLDRMIARVADGIEAQINDARGGAGGVLSDAQMDRMVSQRAALWNEDPEALLGHLQLAGRQAQGLSANMEAAYLVGQRVMQDALNLRSRVSLGMLEEFGGSLPAAREALMQHLEVANSAFASGQAMQAAAGRAVRRLRGDFAFQQADLQAMRGLTDEQFMATLEAVGHDFSVASRLVKPGFWSGLKDDVATLYINNLLWGLRTHWVNTITNTYMATARPLERAIGFGVRGEWDQVAQQWRQYQYMGASLGEAFSEAVRTWKSGESIMSPGRVSDMSAEGFAQGNVAAGQNWTAASFRPWTTTGNVMANFYTAFMKTASTPTRALGSMDEFAKQLTYRGKVMADASTEALAQGLEGQAVTDYIRKSLNKAFDDAGRAIDAPALYESEMATFQQALLPGSFGAGIQHLVANTPTLRFVVPFVKTPTNVLRMGWKMTPGLNMLQKEYRDMIGGVYGEERQAQAIGHMALGGTFMGTAAWLAYTGYVTGGGPSDPKLKATLQATGWQPYSFVVPNEDGSKTYVNYGRYDPVAMPFGMIADIIDVVTRDQDGDGFGERAMQAAEAMFLGLTKQMAQKTYLTSLHDTIEALTDPDKSMGKWVGRTAGNFVPFSSGLRFSNLDPNVREVRGILDGVMSQVPGLSEKLPPKRDPWGDPILVHKGLWVDGSKDAVDWEVARMIDQSVISPIGPPGNRTVQGVDLREITMSDGRNAFDAYQEMAGHPPRGLSLKEQVGKLMASPAYQRAPDGDADTKGTRSAMLTGTISKYRQAALKRVQADPVVREAIATAAAKSRAAVTEAYSAKSDTQTGSAAIQQLGRGFGVDLGGLLPNQ